MNFNFVISEWMFLKTLYVKKDDFVDLFVVLCKHGVESFSLRNGAGELTHTYKTKGYRKYYFCKCMMSAGNGSLLQKL